MIEWINFTVLLFSSLLFLYFYVRSVSPAGRELVFGAVAYRLCFYDRLVAGLRDAGEESIRPKKEQTMYCGIYTRIRHPQAVGEVFLFPVMGILLHSPFLTLFSLIYFPIFVIMCYAEEQDLLLRYGQIYAEYCQRTGAFWPMKAR